MPELYEKGSQTEALSTEDASDIDESVKNLSASPIHYHRSPVKSRDCARMRGDSCISEEEKEITMDVSIPTASFSYTAEEISDLIVSNWRTRL